MRRFKTKNQPKFEKLADFIRATLFTDLKPSTEKFYKMYGLLIPNYFLHLFKKKAEKKLSLLFKLFWKTILISAYINKYIEGIKVLESTSIN